MVRNYASHHSKVNICWSDFLVLLAYLYYSNVKKYRYIVTNNDMTVVRPLKGTARIKMLEIDPSHMKEVVYVHLSLCRS